MDQLETEVKFFIEDPPAMRGRIRHAGGALVGARVLERNLCFDDDCGSFRQRSSVLRLRTDGQTTLTLKMPADQDSDQFKVMQELEVTVSDAPTMEKLLLALGYHQAQVYEKWRETFRLNGALLCLDAMPFGDFLEIEGPREAIVSLSRQLGLKWENRILRPYLKLFEKIKQDRRLPFSDITFDNFRGLGLDARTLRPLFESDRRT